MEKTKEDLQKEIVELKKQNKELLAKIDGIDICLNEWVKETDIHLSELLAIPETIGAGVYPRGSDCWYRE